jgi:hypothetical protein
MSISTPVHVGTGIVGAAIRQDRGYRFIATDLRVAELDQTVWHSLEAVRQAARQLVETGRINNLSPNPLEE